MALFLHRCILSVFFMQLEAMQKIELIEIRCGSCMLDVVGLVNENI